jgi:hypothetical protein
MGYEHKATLNYPKRDSKYWSYTVARASIYFPVYKLNYIVGL